MTTDADQLRVLREMLKKRTPRSEPLSPALVAAGVYDPEDNEYHALTAAIARWERLDTLREARTTHVLSVVLAQMTAIGRGWRASWSDFDGRTLRAQLNGIADWAGRALTDSTLPDYTHGTEFEEEQENG